MFGAGRGGSQIKDVGNGAVYLEGGGTVKERMLRRGYISRSISEM